MEVLHRLRVELDSGPGALGRLGRVIESLGGSIVTIDLQNINAGLAVDDVTASFPEGSVSPESVAQALADQNAGTLRAWAKVDEAVDPLLQSIRWACSIVSAGPTMADDEVIRVIGEMCGTNDAWLLTLEDDIDVEAIRHARVNGSPAVVELDDVHSQLPKASFAGAAVVLAVPDSKLNPNRVAVLARPAAQTFSATEMERLQAILAIHRQATRSATPAEMPSGCLLPRLRT